MNNFVTLICRNEQKIYCLKAIGSPNTWRFSMLGVVGFLLRKESNKICSDSLRKLLTLIKRNFMADVFLKNIMEHKAVFWVCFYFHSFKLLRKLYFLICSISFCNFVFKMHDLNVRKTLHLEPFPCCTFFMLHSFHFALFSCCTFSMLHFFV